MKPRIPFLARKRGEGRRREGRRESEMPIADLCLNGWSSADGTILRASGSFAEVGSSWWKWVTEEITGWLCLVQIPLEL